MTSPAVQQALEDIYTSFNQDNLNLDAQIEKLKTALGGGKEVEMTPTRLPHNNREGRKLLQSYFKRKGVIVKFAE
ncbi:MAG: hypothetical protein GC136_00770 [Alphaproteobacteria bacterium]|nr:hypothetical protein [Alphaproteobacteria bacterium]